MAAAMSKPRCFGSTRPWVLNVPFCRANAVETRGHLASPWLLQKRSRSTDAELSRRNPRPIAVRSDRFGRLDDAILAPSSDISTVELQFDSHANAANFVRTRARKSALYWRPPGNDETLPNSPEDRVNLVRMLKQASKDDSLVRSGSHGNQAWSDHSPDLNVHFDDTIIEAACWRLAVS